MINDEAIDDFVIKSLSNKVKALELEVGFVRLANEQLEALCRKLAEACDKLEWSERDSFYNPRCPDCGSLEKQGHMDDCKLFAALSDARKAGIIT